MGQKLLVFILKPSNTKDTPGVDLLFVLVRKPGIHLSFYSSCKHYLYCSYSVSMLYSSSLLVLYISACTLHLCRFIIDNYALHSVFLHVITTLVYSLLCISLWSSNFILFKFSKVGSSLVLCHLMSSILKHLKLSWLCLRSELTVAFLIACLRYENFFT